MKHILFLFVFSLWISSCGKVSDFSFSIEEDNEKQYFDLMTKVDANSYRLPIFSLPLYDFSKGLVVGDISVSSDNIINMRLQTDVLQGVGMGFDWSLPNGRPIPYILKPETKAFYFQIGQTNSRVYLAFDNDQAVLGLALNISQLPPTQMPGGLNAFVPFAKEKVSGTMGLYLGNEFGQNGFALFIDFSQAVGANTSELANYIKRPSQKAFRHTGAMAREYLKDQDLDLY